MANLLYLVHRLPYPPNKGDKVRSYHLLKHLAASHNVYLGTFVDDSDDMQHLPVVQAMCAGLCAVVLSPVVAAAECVAAIKAKASEALMPASTVAEYVSAIDKLLADAANAQAVGQCARTCVTRSYSWNAHLSFIDQYLPRADNDLAEVNNEVAQ